MPLIVPSLVSQPLPEPTYLYGSLGDSVGEAMYQNS